MKWMIFTSLISILKLLILCSKVNREEFVLRSLRSLNASPLAKPFVMPCGWHEQKFVYWLIERSQSEGLKCVRTSLTNRFPLEPVSFAHFRVQECSFCFWDYPSVKFALHADATFVVWAKIMQIYQPLSKSVMVFMLDTMLESSSDIIFHGIHSSTSCLVWFNFWMAVFQHHDIFVISLYSASVSRTLPPIGPRPSGRFAFIVPFRFRRCFPKNDQLTTPFLSVLSICISKTARWNSFFL